MRVEAGEQDEILTMRQGIEEAILHRYSPDEYEMSEKGHDFYGRSLVEIARLSLERRGVSTRMMPRERVASRALHTTSDFPAILQNIANKTMMVGYDRLPQTFRPFISTRELPDFKTASSVQLGEGSSLAQKDEHGEFKRGTISDGKETYNLLTYGRIFGVTRETLLNDDLGAFTEIPQKLGALAADKESDLVWAIITDNDALADGTKLFASGHNNLASSSDKAAPSVSTLDVARAAMRKQKGLDNGRLNIIPMHLMAPAALEGTVRKFLATEMLPNKAGDVNPHAGSLDPIIEPRLDDDSGTAWYLAGDPSRVPTIVLARLEGQQGPVMDTREGWEFPGVQWRVYMDRAAKALDHRGLYKNPGA